MLLAASARLIRQPDCDQRSPTFRQDGDDRPGHRADLPQRPGQGLRGRQGALCAARAYQDCVPTCTKARGTPRAIMFTVASSFSGMQGKGRVRRPSRESYRMTGVRWRRHALAMQAGVAGPVPKAPSARRVTRTPRPVMGRFGSIARFRKAISARPRRVAAFEGAETGVKNDAGRRGCRQTGPH